jgi:Ca2+-binding EF-hand superfamily protein
MATLTNERIAKLLKTFQNHDVEGRGALTHDELILAYRALGPDERPLSDEQLLKLAKELDRNNDGLVGLVEFTEIAGHEDEIKNYKVFFDELDVDGSGLLSAKEVLAVLKKSNVPNPKDEVKSMFAKAKKKTNEELNFDEFVSLMIYSTVLFPKKKVAKGALTFTKLEELKTSFDFFDKDLSGKISLTEFKALAQKLGKSVTEAELKDMIKEADTNGDGEIGFSEFVAVMGYNEDVSIYKNAFLAVDRDRSGCVEEEELVKLLLSMGIPKAKSEAKNILKAKKKQGKKGKGLTFDEFVELMAIFN